VATAKEITAETKDRMKKAVSHLREEFGGIRTGRASSAQVEKIMVDYYGAQTPLQQLAGFSVPEARVLVVQPYDKGAMKAIEKAIQQSDLGINPGNDGQVIRLTFPQLTEERRKDLVKVVKNRAEDGRVSVRNVRRDARKELEAIEKAGDISRDELERVEKDLEKATAEVIAEIDEMVTHKERELLEV
jgi:ribosome recycling factor